MLLGALPEALRQDVIASRRMTTTGILFRLFTTYQPGGAGERTGLIKSISEVKVPAGLGDLLGSIRQRRRSLGRSYELRVTIDPLVLTGVLSKFAEGTGKLGGSQVAFRLASMRQQLDVARTPGWESVNDWAEYIQAELEELANAQFIAGKATPSNPPALAPVLTQGNPAVKALYGDGQKPWERPDGEKAPCRFWGTDEGCRRGEKCTFAHAWGSLEKSSRCLLCSSTKHRKKDCPTVKPKDGNGGAQRGDRKIAKTQEKKGPKGSEKDSQKKTPPPQPAKEAAEETPQPEKRSEGSQPKESDLVQNLSGLVNSMTSIKSMYKAGGDDSGEYALLDGGATHALRQAKNSEVPHLWPVQVEMAMGSVTLYKCPAHNTLLALDSVEPIIPLRLLVDHGFKIEWQRDRCDISHPKHGRLECVRRQGCPVMERQAALNLLDSLERGGVGDTYELTEPEMEWRKKRYPQAPERIWALMRPGLNWEEVESPYWNGLAVELWFTCSLGLGEIQRSGGILQVLTPKCWPWTSQRMIRKICYGPTYGDWQRRVGSEWSQPVHRAGLWVGCAISLRVLARWGAGRSCVLGWMTWMSASWWRWMEIPPCGWRPWVYMRGLKKEWPNMVSWVDAAWWSRIPRSWRVCGWWEGVSIVLGMGGNGKGFLTRQPDMFKIRVDQGALGHQRPKPTTLLTNMEQMKELDGIAASGPCEEIHTDLERKLKQTVRSAWKPWALRSHAEERRVKSPPSGGRLWAICLRYGSGCIQAQKGQVCLDRDDSGASMANPGGDWSLTQGSQGRSRSWFQGCPQGGRRCSSSGWTTCGAGSCGRRTGGSALGSWTKGLDSRGRSQATKSGLGGLREERSPRDLKGDPGDQRHTDGAYCLTASGWTHESIVEVACPSSILGIPVYRLHSDCERSMTTKGIAKWCESRQIYQTFNAGDEPEANGRVEGEVHQFKRRLRLLLRDAGVDHAYWPCAARHGAEERLRSQLRKLGAKCKETPPFAALAQVKAKRWHRLKEGALSSPYKTLRIMGPSPAMTNGWVALDEAANLVQHARSVFVPDPLSDVARLELESVEDPKHPPRRRLYGKQPRDGPGEVSTHRWRWPHP